jgi:iron complex transport system substrate-binding protein
MKKTTPLRLLALSLCALFAAAEGRTVTDMAGCQVAIPETVSRIAVATFNYNEIIASLGAAGKIVATPVKASGRPWLYRLNPSMVASVKSIIMYGSINYEDLLKAKPQVIFMGVDKKTADKMAALGIVPVQLSFTDYEGLKKCVALIGGVIGGASAARAEAYNAYLDAKIGYVGARTAGLKDGDKPKVLHLGSYRPALTADGSGTIVDAWIRLAGGLNAADGVKGNIQQVSPEQILSWNPDVVVIGRVISNDGISESKADELADFPGFERLPAIRGKRVFVNPDGCFSWDRYCSEAALQLLWAAKTLHPELFADLDLEKETRDFFKAFMDYALSSDEAERMLTGLPPR